MELVTSNWVVAKKVQESFFVPAEIREVAVSIARSFSDNRSEKKGALKNKWMVYVAALIAFSELGPEAIRDRIGQVGAAKSTDDYSGLTARAREWAHAMEQTSAKRRVRVAEDDPENAGPKKLPQKEERRTGGRSDERTAPRRSRERGAAPGEERRR